MKIAIIHQYYLMPGQSGGTRFNEMARMWCEMGHDVTVIAGCVDHASGVSPEKYRGRLLTHEQDGKVQVIRCYVPKVYSKGFLGRKLGFLGFTLSASCAALRVARPDVVIATSPPLITAIPGWIAARLRYRAVPWIFEVRDLWPESAVTTGVLARDSYLTQLLYGMERWACKSASMVNVLTPAFRADIVQRGLAQESKICFVPNGADLDMFVPSSRDNAVRRELGWGDRFVALYAGAHGRANAVGQLVQTAELLRDRPDILIVTCGDGPERRTLERTAHAAGLSNIQFLGPQDKKRMPEFVNAADLGVAVLQNNPTFRTVYPNKVFDYMACAKPTLIAIDGIARELICTEAKAGLFAEPENATALASQLRLLADDPALCAEFGSNGRAWAQANASRTSLAERYVKIMETLTGQIPMTSEAA